MIIRLFLLIFILFPFKAYSTDIMSAFDDKGLVVANNEHERFDYELNKKVENLADLGISSTATELDQVCDGIGATGTAANLTTLTNGSNADSLHTHSSVSWEFDSGWFTANVNTLYTKAHGISMSFPTNGLNPLVLWRASSGGSYMIKVERSRDASENTEQYSWNGTNFYLKAINGWGRYTDSSGTFQLAANGELRVFARKQT